MSPLVAGVDAGGSSVKAWVRGGGRTLATVTVATATLRPAAHRVERDPASWELACRTALTAAVEQAARPAAEYSAVTVSSLRQAFVLLDAAGAAVGPAVLNSDRRGGPYAGVLDGHYFLTGHWPAPELTLPKLLAVRAEEPDRWARTVRVLFVHDWLLWLLCGEQVTEASYACAGGMADVAARDWAFGLLGQVGIDVHRLAPVVQAGTVVGRLRAGWGLPPGLPVVAGSGDTQLAAAGVGGLSEGVVVVVAGSSTPVMASTALPVRDSLVRPWVSTHALPDRWAVEGNAGYPGSYSGWWADLVPTGPMGPGGVLAVTATPYWAQETWQAKPPTSLLGLRSDTTSADVAVALLQAHAFAVRGNVDDLARALGQPAEHVVVTGGAAADGALPALLAQVLGRDVRHSPTGGAAGAGELLAARALGVDVERPALPEVVVRAGDARPWQGPYERWCAAHAALRVALPE